MPLSTPGWVVAYSFAQSAIRAVTQAVTQAVTHSAAHQFTHSLNQSIPHPLTHPLTHSLAHFLARSLTYTPPTPTPVRTKYVHMHKQTTHVSLLRAHDTHASAACLLPVTCLSLSLSLSLSFSLSDCGGTDTPSWSDASLFGLMTNQSSADAITPLVDQYVRDQFSAWSNKQCLCTVLSSDDFT